MNKWAKQKQSGFTIVELLIVIVVIGILAAITIVAYNGIQTRARNAERTTEIAAVQKALEMYRIDNSVYPTNDGSYSFAPLASALVPKYMSAIPTDPISTTPYNYVTDGAGMYAIKIIYEPNTVCKRGNNNSEPYSWWNIGYCS